MRRTVASLGDRGGLDGYVIATTTTGSPPTRNCETVEVRQIIDGGSGHIQVRTLGSWFACAPSAMLAPAATLTRSAGTVHSIITCADPVITLYRGGGRRVARRVGYRVRHPGTTLRHCATRER